MKTIFLKYAAMMMLIVAAVTAANAQEQEYVSPTNWTFQYTNFGLLKKTG